MVTCRSIQYVAQPFRVKPGDKGTTSKASSKLLDMDVTT